MNIKLSEFTSRGGCGCKINKEELSYILEKVELFEPTDLQVDGKLLVGYGGSDDSCGVQLDNNQVLLSSCDFFTPIVNDAFLFGQIAAANAVSDIYVMGGTPTVALCILCWPLDKIDKEVASRVLAGAKSLCNSIGVPIGGGHSINGPEPVFGLSVCGTVDKANLKRNTGAMPGDMIFMSKRIGVGIACQLYKHNITDTKVNTDAEMIMLEVNTIGQRLGGIAGVTAMTDITGFGFLGHLMEILDNSDVSATVDYNDIPRITHIENYLALNIYPSSLMINCKYYSKRCTGLGQLPAMLLSDPQTNGGVLFTINPEAMHELDVFREIHNLWKVGYVEDRNSDYVVKVLNGNDSNSPKGQKYCGAKMFYDYK